MMISFDKPLAVPPALTLPGRVILAPMQGVMTSVFAKALQEMQLAKTVITPFFSTGRESVPSLRALRKFLAPWPNTPDQPKIVQLMGRDPDALAETALRLAEAGYPAVNLNFACPAPMVVRAGHGGACLREPRLMGSCIRAVLRAGGDRITLSVKLRTGWSSPDEIRQIAPVIRDSGVPLAVVHFRTVSEMYGNVENPLPRLARFREQLPDTLLFGNGDIRSADDAVRMCAETGCDGVAAARGIMRDPFLLKKIATGSDEPSSEADRMRFLKTLFRCSADAKKWRRNGFLECVRLCSGGEDSELFQRCIRMSDTELTERFS